MSGICKVFGTVLATDSIHSNVSYYCSYYLTIMDIMEDIFANYLSGSYIF